jgi:hypothetical protein
MFFATAIAASIICTSQVSVSGDPHAWENATRIFVDEANSKAEMKTYGFRALDAWGVEDIETLLTDERMSKPVTNFEVEEVIHSHGSKKRTLELYEVDNNWTWTMKGVLRVDGDKGEFEEEVDYKTFITPMNCTWPAIQ